MLLGCLLAFCLHVAVSAAAAPNIAQIDFNIYHKAENLVNELKTIACNHPGSMNMQELHGSEGNYSASLLVFSSKQSGIKQREEDKLRILMSFGEHGRELITTEVGLKFIETLANKTKVKQLFGSDERGEKLVNLLDKISFKIFPNENANGRNVVEGGQLCERRNGRGVDPNRNWDIDFGKKEADYDPTEEYPGAYAFSEPEVKMIHEIATDFKPHVWVNVHSGMEAMFMPYDHIGEIPQGDLAQKQLELLNTLKNDMCPSCAVGSGGKTVGYVAHGTATDYMFTNLNVPLAFTWEIFGDWTAHRDDCFKMFNPIDKESFDKVVDQWTKTLFRLLELLPTHPALESFGTSNITAQPGANPTDGNNEDGVVAGSLECEEAVPSVPIVSEPVPNEQVRFGIVEANLPQVGNSWLSGSIIIVTVAFISVVLVRRGRNRINIQHRRDL